MDTITVYTAKELKDSYPNGFEVAHAKYNAGIIYYDFWTEEIMESLKGIFKASGIELTNWSIGAFSPSHVNFNMPYEETSNEVYDLEGHRALAWLENNLLWHLRISFNHPKRNEYRKYGSSYAPGKIKPCPFTGVYADDEFLNALIKEVTEGMCLGDAYLSLSDMAQELMEVEIECQESEEYFLESAEANEWQYTENGVMI